MIEAEKRTYEHILVEADGPIARITMNRPDKRNALSLTHMQELTECFKAIGEAREVQVVVLAGKGPAFCAGHDLSEMIGRDPETYRRWPEEPIVPEKFVDYFGRFGLPARLD